MLSSLSKIAYTFSFIVLSLFSVQASEITCPKNIAVIEGDPLGELAAKTLISTYKNLGCEVTTIARPGLRGIADFNKGLVDGELFRLELVENAYEREFVRSAVPLLSLKNSLWLHREADGFGSNTVIGYVPGINWHKKVVLENALEGYSYVPFHTETELHKAFEYRKIIGFLSEKQTIDILIAQERFKVNPVEEHSFGERPLYHYLGLEFIEFMDVFSDYLKKEKPYQHLN
ncbi:hypothetical protein [Curvivirga aplysinae]|uniref:hypothetical protein n=1 Tax=Curvivirga aplysinae TaxID=2529852 RepID=UPI0012BBBC48|nr:hypothetical protein [Curvivirga aplysinae]MTI10928.1 hypothetical protein [Curvivirga aplysinae]